MHRIPGNPQRKGCGNDWLTLSLGLSGSNSDENDKDHEDNTVLCNGRWHVLKHDIMDKSGK